MNKVNKMKGRYCKINFGKSTSIFAAPFVVLIIICLEQTPQTSAIFNCFTPNSMFKMGKGGGLGQTTGAYGQHSGERASWYPQYQHGYHSHFPGYGNGMGSYAGAGYGQGGGMKSLFQPKWRGTSLFGPKKWMDWRMGASSNFYRPGYGYMNSLMTPQTIAQPGTYVLNDQLVLPPNNNNINQATIAQPNPYGNSQQTNNDGWSIPYNQASSRLNQQQQQQQTYNNNNNQYDSYSVSPGAQAFDQYNQPAKQLDPNFNSYGTKGSSGAGQRQQQQQQQQQQQLPYNTTRNSILVADGGYNSYDANYLMGQLESNNNYFNPRLDYATGYAYPKWYTSRLDSPAKVSNQSIKVTLAPYYGG